MKTQPNMKTRRSLLSPIVRSPLVGIIGGVPWSGTSAQVATQAPTVQSTLSIPVVGTVTEAGGTTIFVGGYVTVKSTMVTDVLGTPPIVVLTFDFSNVYGVSGGPVLKNSQVYVTGGHQATKIRPLRASDVIPITSPYFTGAAGLLSANSWLVTTTLNFNVSTGVLTSGSGTVGNNPY